MPTGTAAVVALQELPALQQSQLSLQMGSQDARQQNHSNTVPCNIFTVLLLHSKIC